MRTAAGVSSWDFLSSITISVIYGLGDEVGDKLVCSLRAYKAAMAVLDIFLFA